MPISLALLIPVLNNLTNNYFLGRVGERELAVNGVAGIFYLILSMVGYGLSSGIQIQFSRRAAQTDYNGIARLLTNGGMLTIFLSLCLIGCSLLLTPFIFGYSLHVPGHVVMSVEFIYIRILGLPFLMLTQLANAFYISTGRSKYLVAGSLTMTGMNILLDYLFIFGNWGFPALGLNGAALSSVIAETCACVIMWGLFFIQKYSLEFPILRHLKFDLSLCRKMLHVAAPLILQFFFSIGGWQVFFIFVEHLGERELAASQILRPTFGVIGISSWAFATTCNTMVSNIIGQGKSNRVFYLIAKVVRLSLSVTVAQCALLILLARPYLQLFTADTSLIDLALPSLYVIVSGSMIMSVATVLFNGVVGTGNTRVNLLMEIFCVGIYLVYCYLVIERARLSLAWAWGAEFVYWSSLVIVSLVYLKSNRWRGKVL